MELFDRLPADLRREVNLFARSIHPLANIIKQLKVVMLDILLIDNNRLKNEFNYGTFMEICASLIGEYYCFKNTLWDMEEEGRDMSAFSDLIIKDYRKFLSLGYGLIY